MRYNVYSVEFKLAMIEEFNSRSVTIREFANEKNISPSTFSSWLYRLRKEESSMHNVVPVDNGFSPIEVTNEVKAIINDDKKSGSFSLKVKNMVLTFSISNLKEVFEAIKND